MSKAVEGAEPTPFIAVRIKDLGADVKMRQYDLVAGAYLGNIEIEHLEFKGDHISSWYFGFFFLVDLSSSRHLASNS